VITTLLLAAGASRRFGSDKLLATLDDGTPVVVEAARKLVSADCRVLAVIRPGAVTVTSLLAELPSVAVTSCADADRGMGHSIAWGVSQSADASGWLVALGDMPFLKPASVRAVLQRLEQGASIVAPIYDHRRGHPVGFSSRWRQDLLTLIGDQGGVSVIRRYPRTLELVPCTDSGVLRDVDLPSDLGRFDKA